MPAFAPQVERLEDIVSMSTLMSGPHVVASPPAAHVAPVVVHQANSFAFNPFHGQLSGYYQQYGWNNIFVNLQGNINGHPVGLTGSLTLQGTAWYGTLNMRGNAYYDTGLYSDIYVSTSGTGSYGVVSSNMTSLPAGGSWLFGLYNGSAVAYF